MERKLNAQDLLLHTLQLRNRSGNPWQQRTLLACLRNPIQFRTAARCSCDCVFLNERPHQDTMQRILTLSKDPILHSLFGVRQRDS
jgi:hypothetical protein